MASSKYADEGTIAHALAAMCLVEGSDAAAFIGRIIEAEDYEHAGLSPSGAHRWMYCPGSFALESREPFEERKFEMEVDEDMARDVQVYVDNIRKYRDNNGEPGVLFIEQQLPVDHITGEPGATGTGDAVILIPREIQSHDLKFGKGKAVKPDDNEQCLLYASGVVKKFGDMIDDLDDDYTIRLVIHQPRLFDAPLEWTCTLRELRAFEKRASNAAAAAIAVKEQELPFSLDGHGDYLNLKPGDSQCQFCSVKATCPALAKKVEDAVGMEFATMATIKPEEIAKHVNVVDHDLLGQKMAATDLVEMWVKAVRAKNESELLATGNDPDVCISLGHKLVQGRKGNRSWINTEEVTAYLKKSARLKDDVMYKFTLITPTKAEELFMPKKGVKNPKRWETLLGMIGQTEGKPSVAPLDDPRPALAFKSVEEEFGDVTPGAVNVEDFA